MTSAEICVKIYSRRKKRIPERWIRERKTTMFTVVRRSYFGQESLRKASLDLKKWGFGSVCPDKIRLVRNIVRMDVGLPG